MASSKDHYEKVLTPVYSWMYGGFDAALERNAAFFDRHGIRPERSGLALDLGAGCGFQSIVLARLGYDVVAIDLDAELLEEMKAHSEGLPIRGIQDDLLRFAEHLASGIELAVCMTDTLLHLDSRDAVRELIGSLYAAMQTGGRFIVTFRDLSRTLEELDRFIPVRSDATTVFTCFLEYEPETVKVHDLVYRKIKHDWVFSCSYYRKLRLSRDWVLGELTGAGFAISRSDVENGMVTIIAAKER